MLEPSGSEVAVLILSGPGLRAEAEESKLPLEMIEYRAIREAAADVARGVLSGGCRTGRNHPRRVSGSLSPDRSLPARHGLFRLVMRLREKFCYQDDTVPGGGGRPGVHAPREVKCAIRSNGQ